MACSSNVRASSPEGVEQFHEVVGFVGRLAVALPALPCLQSDFGGERQQYRDYCRWLVVA